MLVEFLNIKFRESPLDMEEVRNANKMLAVIMMISLLLEQGCQPICPQRNATRIVASSRSP